VANGPTQVYTNCYIECDIPSVAGQGQMAQLLFNSFIPPEWSTQTPKHKFFGDQGKIEVLAGGARNEDWSPAQLGRGVDTGYVLYNWVQEIRQNGPTNAKKDIQIKVQAPDGSSICVWSGKGAVITHFKHSQFLASSNEIVTESVTIDAEMWDMLDGGGNPINGGPDGGGGGGGGGGSN
jgi:phage tail-like protein